MTGNDAQYTTCHASRVEEPAHVDSVDCWCCPERLTVCDECVVENCRTLQQAGKLEAAYNKIAHLSLAERTKRLATPGCWKCDGSGWFETTDESVSMLVHR